MTLTEKDIVVRQTYRAKRFREWLGFTNDRTVLWIGTSLDRSANQVRKVQYDSDTVKDGRSYPIIEMAKFLKWAKEERI